jgi:hypothetical protein
MGSPDGGWYDDTPPRVVSSTPDDQGVNVKGRKVTINFSEYIKLDDPQNKVIISPPQIEMADIKAAGRRITVDLKDSLKANTTYRITVHPLNENLYSELSFCSFWSYRGWKTNAAWKVTGSQTITIQ